MGGGDLNLKKSWHPNTMRNMEKVWQAEQRHEAEQKRIAELQKELREEREREEVRKYAEDQGVIEKKDGTKLDWMYQGPGGAVDREEYLLGRAIDKTLENQLQSEKSIGSNSRMHPEYDGMPTQILRGIATIGSEQVDMARKLNEDPLSAIRKKEIETKTQLLSNPVKLKQLKQVLHEQTKHLKSSHKKHKKDKKNKKKKHKRHRGSSSSESEGESKKSLDELLAAKYSQLRKHLKQDDLKEMLAPNNSSSDSDTKHHRKHSATRQKKHSDDDSDDERHRKKKKFGLIVPGGSTKSSSERRKSPHRSRSPVQQRPSSSRSAPSKPQKPSTAPRRLTEEEKAARLREMQSNASWRDEERSKNVKRYREEDKKESQLHAEQFDKKFINKQLSKAATEGSVEGRIKSNLNYIQRSGAAMSKNFARR